MTSTISVPAAKLRLMLTAVLPHACRDDTLPALCGVSFEFRDGTLFLAATDRYTIGIAREPVPGSVAAEVPAQSAILPLEAARALRRMLKKQAGVAAVIIGSDTLSVECAAVSGSWRATDGKFVDWRPLLHGALTGTLEPLGDSAGVNPQELSRLGIGAGRTGTALNIRLLASARSGPVPMVMAIADDWFIGAVMPVRHFAGEEDSDYAIQWESWVAATAPAGKADAPAGAPPETAAAGG
jgi:hypothetical protein